MPTYDYVCTTCGHTYEAFQRMSETPHTLCPCEKQEPVKRQIGTGAGFIFKGSGFYETDFKDKKGTPPASGDKPASDKPAESAPAAKSEPSSGSTSSSTPSASTASTAA